MKTEDSMTKFKQHIKEVVFIIESHPLLSDFGKGKLTAYKDILNDIERYETKAQTQSIVVSFSADKVDELLKTQRANCVVAVMKYITDDEILEKIENAPMYDYKSSNYR